MLRGILVRKSLLCIDETIFGYKKIYPDDRIQPAEPGKSKGIYHMDTQETITKGVKTLRGDPKKAILKLSGPMMIAMFVQGMYNLVDAIWVSGLGPDALAAVGLFFPFMMFLMGFSNGIGIGGGSAVSRKIGAKDRIAADNTAVHTLLLTIGMGLIFSLPFIPILKNIYEMMGARGAVNKMASGYSRIVFGGALFLFFANMGNNILRSEGDAKRSMYAIIFGAFLNIILDPIFIYVLKLGVVGAAWATVVSMASTAVILFYWLFMKRNTYVTMRVRNFRPDRKIIGEILRVGMPASLSMISMSISMYLLNAIIMKASGTNGIAVFTSGWRIVSMGTIPLIGVATGVTAVTGAAFGEKNPQKLKSGFLYAVKIGVLIELTVAVSSFIFAVPLSRIFTYSQDAKVIAPDLIMFLRWMAPLYPTIPFGMLTSAMFQGIGKGERSFAVTILRTVILQVVSSYIFGIVLGFGLVGVFWGIITGNVIAVSIAFLWGKITIKRMLTEK